MEEMYQNPTDEELLKQYQKPSDEEILDQVTREKEILVRQGVTIVEFDPEEADLCGAFEEDALSEEDAYEARYDVEG